MFRRHTRQIGLPGLTLFLTGLGILLLNISLLLLWHVHTPPHVASHSALHAPRPDALGAHPIDKLIADANEEFDELISKRATNLKSAAEAYRKRRGRHPPPGFDAWFDFAQKHDAMIVEGMFDQIYRDLDPFWGVSARSMRDFASHHEDRISVRNRTASMTQKRDQGTAKDRMDAWLGLVKSIEGLLPDLDMALNIMDESRVIVPWEDTRKYLESELETRNLLPNSEITSSYQGRSSWMEVSQEPPKVDWIGGGDSYWNTARVACAPHSPGRSQAPASNFIGPPPGITGHPEHSYEGYVQNWTYARDPCQQGHLQELHGTFIEPISIFPTRALVPIFSESKLQLNSDILIPPAAYLSERFNRGEYSDTNTDNGWSKKAAGVVWRGVASGGRNKKENWTRFHRHRFVSMLNGTYAENIETNPHVDLKAQTFMPQSYTTYRLAALQHMSLGVWLKQIVNVGFTELLCWPSTGRPTCPYTDPYFKIVDRIPMKEQFNYKMLPDIDGNSYSGRYLAFLRSTSVPIKATVYSEWHDDRLIPWLHFVPMDNSFVDLYGILDYFLGTGGGDGHRTGYGAHDKKAKNIGSSGQEWANRALRKEDMRIYTLRLLLEYARLCEEDRERLGFVGDVDAS
ncbi:glycosyltransferase family 90 protein [Exserohilum turcica Et28A]|uniref:Glycosyltransferase family 90 protein n=1 Tax=Exserohilum turcicum (strain 28A) TaxID=671987 RepID=R0K8T5_EXST2|nr:glycosyltransferase family 90 protein [Exserohilum turcica Et28A]EOA84657.1 glycosyltransferase family 90 protein [Exserohilum turcica Et28A]